MFVVGIELHINGYHFTIKLSIKPFAILTNKITDIGQYCDVKAILKLTEVTAKSTSGEKN